jgi:hypothetical protein
MASVECPTASFTRTASCRPKPARDSAVPEIVEPESRRQLRVVTRLREALAERRDPVAGLAGAPGVLVMENPRRPLAVVGCEPEPREVVLHRLTKPGRHGNLPRLPRLRPGPTTLVRFPPDEILLLRRDLDTANVETNVMPLESGGLSSGVGRKLASVPTLSHGRRTEHGSGRCPSQVCILPLHQTVVCPVQGVIQQV